VFVWCVCVCVCVCVQLNHTVQGTWVCAIGCTLCKSACSTGCHVGRAAQKEGSCDGGGQWASSPLITTHLACQAPPPPMCQQRTEPTPSTCRSPAQEMGAWDDGRVSLIEQARDFPAVRTTTANDLLCGAKGLWATQLTSKLAVSTLIRCSHTLLRMGYDTNGIRASTWRTDGWVSHAPQSTTRDAVHHNSVTHAHRHSPLTTCGRGGPESNGAKCV
jgi:hypothetical protein